HVLKPVAYGMLPYKMGILVAVLGIWFSSSLVKGDSKAVTTSLTTKWSSTPLLLETR
uniref:Uncharacterized protein n=1 Tax=Anas platyrhynchos platyrhynchos TaxID=8840 RepID=A0A493T1S7_ANAPP